MTSEFTFYPRYSEKYGKIYYVQTILAPLSGHAGGDRVGHFSRIGLQRVEAHCGYSTKELCFFPFL